MTFKYKVKIFQKSITKRLLNSQLAHMPNIVLKTEDDKIINFSVTTY